MENINKKLKGNTLNYFCVYHKNRRKRYFKQLFFKENVHFGTSEQISIYEKPSLLTN